MKAYSVYVHVYVLYLRTYGNSEYGFRLQLLLVSQISYCVWQETQAVDMFAHPLL